MAAATGFLVTLADPGLAVAVVEHGFVVVD